MSLLGVGCSCVGRVQSFISQLLYVVVGETEQPLSTVPAGVGCSENWKVIYCDRHETVFFASMSQHLCLWCILSQDA